MRTRQPRDTWLIPAASGLLLSACAWPLHETGTGSSRTIFLERPLQTAPIEPGAEASRLLRGPSGRFLLELPAGWRVSMAPVLDRLELVRESSQEDGVICVRDYPRAGPLSPEELELLWQQVIPGLRTELLGVEIHAQTERRLGGRQTLQVHYEGRERGDIQRGLLTVIIDDHGVVVINARVPLHQEAVLGPTAWSLASSLRCLEEDRLARRGPALRSFPARGE